MADKIEESNHTQCQNSGSVDNPIKGKVCRLCEKWKLFGEYHKNKSKGDGRESHCTICVAKRKAKNYRKAKIKVRGAACSNQFEIVVKGCPSKVVIDKFSQIFSTSLRDLIEDGSI